jgi:hypothetical protein
MKQLALACVVDQIVNAVWDGLVHSFCSGLRCRQLLSSHQRLAVTVRVKLAKRG